MKAMAGRNPAHFLWRMEGDIAVIQLSRPERKNPLTFESCAEMRDMFRDLHDADDVNAVVFLPNGGNLCSGGDVHNIIGPLVAMDMKGLPAFTRTTGDLVKAMLGCGKPIIAAVDGVAVGAGAIIAMASDLRLATPEAKTAFCSPASALPAATWAPARSCRACCRRRISSTPIGLLSPRNGQCSRATDGIFRRMIHARAYGAYRRFRA